MLKQYFCVIFILSLFFINYSHCQIFSGISKDRETGTIIPYVNIQIFGKNTSEKRGCITDENGFFTFPIANENDSVLFSCVGYEFYFFKIKDLKKLKNNNIFLKEKIVVLNGVGKEAKKMKVVEKTLGVKKIPTSRYMGFAGEIRKGYECGVLIHTKKYTLIEKLHLNTLSCSYDTLFYKLNIYRVKNNYPVEPILQREIYLRVPEEIKEGELIFDLSPYGIELKDNFLVSLEHIKPSDGTKDLGAGCFYFSSDPRTETYYREIHSSHWEKMPGGISISLDVKMEK